MSNKLLLAPTSLKIHIHMNHLDLNISAKLKPLLTAPKATMTLKSNNVIQCLYKMCSVDLLINDVINKTQRKNCIKLNWPLYRICLHNESKKYYSGTSSERTPQRVKIRT